ncbi:MAG TPA: GNAT family N-acetyltransferase [Chloroflexota bacterium]|nr:GNAT family N-acetyltransferase [Chloroflexota bacterium]
MIDSPDNAAAVSLRPPRPAEAEAIQAIWEASYSVDDPAGFSRGGWSVSAWSTDHRVLVRTGRLVGLAAVRAEAAPDGAMPARVALAPDAREPLLASMIVKSAVELVTAADGRLVRLFLPDRADWAVTAAEASGFRPVRTIAQMLLPADAVTPPLGSIEGVRVRSMQADEDGLVLEALNRAWAGTWNFVPIAPAMLAADLHGQRPGMLLGIDDEGAIIGTCHAMFALDDRNPDGQPRAWISNLTVDPSQRGRGLARHLLAAAIADLRRRGATSITLGVDADNPAPFKLYQSVGFEIQTRVTAWDRAA